MKQLQFARTKYLQLLTIFFVFPGGSIQSALNKATRAGDVVCVAHGVYHENLKYMASGVTLQAAPGARVVIDGAVPVTGWSRVGTSNIYTAAWGHYFPPQWNTNTGDARSLPRNQ